MSSQDKFIEINRRIDNFINMLREGESGSGMKEILGMRTYNPFKKVKVDKEYLERLKNCLEDMLELAPVTRAYKKYIVNEFSRYYNIGADFDLIIRQVQSYIDPRNNIEKSIFNYDIGKSVEEGFLESQKMILPLLENSKIDISKFSIFNRELLKEWQEDFNNHYNKSKTI